MSTGHILFFINPTAKDGAARKLWHKARKKYGFLPKDPIDITKVNVSQVISKENPEIIAIAGGDGTVNSVCNAVSRMQKKPILSILPLGLGNALSYCLGVENMDKAVDVLTHPDKKITIDLMKTNIPDHDRGVFNISVGFDARIVLNRKDYPYIGLGAYVLSGLRSLVSHPLQEITFTIDRAVTLIARASSLVIANCPVIGQNYVISPSAKLNDGLLDCTLFSTKYAYITNLRLHGFKHPLYSEHGKVRFKAAHIRIEGEPFVQIDGDPLQRQEGIEIEIMPKQITFLRNSDKHINQSHLPFIL